MPEHRLNVRPSVAGGDVANRRRRDSVPFCQCGLTCAGGKVGPDGPHVIGAQASPGLGFSPDAHGVSDAWQLPPLPVQDVADVGGRHGVDQFKGRDRRTLRSQGKHVTDLGLVDHIAAGVAGLFGMGTFMTSGIGKWLTGFKIVGHWFNPGYGVERSLIGGATGMLGECMKSGLLLGGVGGLVLGAAFGMTDASEAADLEEERLMARYENREERRDKQQAMLLQRDRQRLAMLEQEKDMNLPNVMMRRRGGRDLTEGLAAT